MQKLLQNIDVFTIILTSSYGSSVKLTGGPPARLVNIAI
jgi:hypothetical protein